MKRLPLLALLSVPALISFSAGPALTADDLKLAPGVSFTADGGETFPVVCGHMDDVKLEAGKPALIFFGAAGDLNSNRQAKRLVDLYKKQRQSVKFIVIDVDHPASSEARLLLKQFYPGYVPAQVLVDKEGHPIWSQVGEVARRKLRAHIDTTM